MKGVYLQLVLLTYLHVHTIKSSREEGVLLIIRLMSRQWKWKVHYTLSAQASNLVVQDRLLKPYMSLSHYAIAVNSQVLIDSNIIVYTLL